MKHDPLDRIARDACGMSRPAAINEDATHEAVTERLRVELEEARTRFAIVDDIATAAWVACRDAHDRYLAAKEGKP